MSNAIQDLNALHQRMSALGMTLAQHAHQVAYVTAEIAAIGRDMALLHARVLEASLTDSANRPVAPPAPVQPEQPAPAPASPPPPPPVAAKKPGRPPKSEQPPAPTPPPKAPPAAPEPAETAVLTVEDFRAQVQEHIRLRLEGKTEAVKALMKEYGVDKLSNVPTHQRAEFLTKTLAMGEAL